jgi:hypothetical protein
VADGFSNGDRRIMYPVLNLGACRGATSVGEELHVREERIACNLHDDS